MRKDAREFFLDAYRQFSTDQYLSSDPLEFPHRYNAPQDREVVALISALFAYGNVKAMRKFLADLFDSLGPSPVETFRSNKRLNTRLYYRFQSTDDIAKFLSGLRMIVKQNEESSLFDNPKVSQNPSNDNGPLEIAILNLHERLSKAIGSTKSRGLIHLIGAGGAAKRYCMLFRWMVRKSWPDLGLWTSIQPKDLVYPLDVHIGRLAEYFDLSRRKSNDWKKALEITQAIRSFEPEDPLKFDFAITRPGILKLEQKFFSAKQGDRRINSHD